MGLPAFTVAHRQPTIQFPRIHAEEAGECVRVFGNANGNQANPIEAPDYTAPLSVHIAVWSARGLLPIAGSGFCGGGFCAGGFCGNAGKWAWREPTQLHNGAYCYGVRRSDALHNERMDGQEILVHVRDEPRDPTNLKLAAYDDETNVLTITLRRSEDV